MDQTTTKTKTPNAATVREVLDAARLSIKTALHSHDLSAAKTTYIELCQLAVHFLVNPHSRPAYDVAHVADEARESIALIVAVNAVDRTQAGVRDG